MIKENTRIAWEQERAEKNIQLKAMQDYVHKLEEERVEMQRRCSEMEDSLMRTIKKLEEELTVCRKANKEMGIVLHDTEEEKRALEKECVRTCDLCDELPPTRFLKCDDCIDKQLDEERAKMREKVAHVFDDMERNGWGLVFDGFYKSLKEMKEKVLGVFDNET